MRTVKLPVQKRTEGVSAKEMRANREIPAVIYGAGKENMHLSMDYQTFRRAFNEAGKSVIIDMEVDGTDPRKALVHNVQYDPVTDEIAHVDFVYVDMKQPIHATIPLEFVGIAPAVKDLAGILDIKRHNIEVKCLPGDLVSHIDVDISVLEDFSVVLHVKDLNVPENMEVLHEEEDAVVTVVPPRVEEEEPKEAVEGEEGEEGVEGEEGEEGEKKEDGEEKVE
ncbi:MAG: 50S ribosomal protein L25 [Patescibacteria group bacterium]|nr:50S ribosomal protein L25 [Patescibacteria group bacterium]